MYTEAFETIFSLLKNPEIEDIRFFKSKRFSVKFKQESKRMNFKIEHESIVLFLETLEAYEEISKNNQ